MATPPLYVVQMTDTHLFAKMQHKLLGVQTEATFQEALKTLQGFEPMPDAVLLTGDLSQDGSATSYKRLRDYLQAVPTRFYWLAGNHDRLSIMSQVLASDPKPLANGHHLSADKTWYRDYWAFILLSSLVPGKDSGYLSDETLAFLDQELALASHNPEVQHLAVCLHHPPLGVNSRWLDTTTLKEPERLFTVLDCYPSVKAVIFGHIHQDWHSQRQQVQYFGCPSTCIQFKPSSSEFALDIIPPALRQFWFYDDGRIESALVRIPTALVQPDLKAQGY